MVFPRLLNLINAFSSKSRFKKYFYNKLYRLNYFLATNNSNKINSLFKKDYLIDEINFSDDEINQIYKDLKIKNYIFEETSDKYDVYDYPKHYLKEVNYAWGFDRKYYAKLIKNKLDLRIKELFNYKNYRIEHIWLYETPANSANTNSKFHVDNDEPGAKKCIVYLSDVDHESGPFSIYDKETNKKIVITGKKGTTIFFDQNKCLHAGLPTLKKDRIVLSFCLYPTLRQNIVYQTNKPLNAHHTFNPFTKIS